jgi:hypothetical protein
MASWKQLLYTDGDGSGLSGLSSSHTHSYLPLSGGTVDGALVLTGGNATMTFSNSNQISHLQLNTPDGGSMKGGISIGGGASSTQAQSHWLTVRDASYHPWAGFTDYDTAIWTSTSSGSYGSLWFGTRDTKALKLDTSQNATFYGTVTFADAQNDAFMMRHWNGVLISAMEIGSAAASGPALTFAESTAQGGAMFAGAQGAAPSGYHALTGFTTQRYMNVQRDYSTTEINWSTSVAGASSWNMSVFMIDDFSISFPTS